MKNTRRSLLTSAICLLLCFSMLLGTTFAWFTDMAASNDNVVKSGELNAEMYWSESYLSADASGWKRTNGDPIFTYDNWEPGYTDIKYIKVENAGDLAFKWRLTIEAAGELTELADVIDVYYVNPVDATLTALDGKVSSGSLRAVVNSRIATTGVLLPEGESASCDTVLAIALHMDKEAGNKYQGMSIGDGFSINLVATQYDYESDAFGSGYDTDAEWPTPAISGTVTMTAPVTRAADDTVAAPVTLTSENGKLRAIIPAGAKLAPGVTELTAVAKDVAAPKANIVVSSTEVATSLDFHVYGLAADNDVPVRFEADEFLPRGLNVGNYDLYHVENGTTNRMTLLAAGAASVHNGYEYDPATGNSALHLATFSEIALVADTVNAWNGTYATAFAGGKGTEEDPYLIANADQLAYLGEVISNENAAYGDKHYKLINDINLGGEEAANAGYVFYPIGYHKVGGQIATVDLDYDAPEFLYFDEDPDYARGTATVIDDNGDSDKWYTYGGSLQGTFDGDGHTIANVYQNTWQMRGNYDGHYYKEAMGIFGYVNGGTVKNLSVNNFSSDGEFTPTGVIAAYARAAAFENIAITNCNPRVYNTGNGGIVGIGGHSTADTDSDKISFTNITIDNTNKITALWGSWDVACGGLIGMFRGAGHVDMTNCHVAAQIDVYNDVCGNYQYYWYRYSGMMIGTNKNMITDDKGYTVPETDKFHAENCTVHFGDWNNYYYCELVANSIASYTHDHQFSRLTEVDAVDVENMTYTVDGETRAIPTSGRVNYVVVNGSHATENATCYHFVNGAVWNHEDAGTEVVGGQTILKEDRQHYYLPFNQLFTGYGWGVKHIPVYNGEDYAFDGITILDRTEAGSIEKFEFVYDNSVISADKEVTITKLISYLQNCGVDVNSASFHISITNLDENGKVTVSVNRDNSDWKKTTVTFKNTGKIRLTVQDYYYCTPTSIELTVVDRAAVANKLTGDFLYRVGNKNAVEFGLLFTTDNDDKVEAINPDSVDVEITAITDGVNYTITNTTGTDWRNGTVQFTGTGLVKIVVTDKWYDNSKTELILEVVDGTNTTGATSATSGNVVLLGNISSGFTVSGRYTFYGNGFTLNYTGNGQYLNNGLREGVVNVSENGTLDNLKIEASVYPSSYLYYDEVKNGPASTETATDGTVKTRYHYQLSAVVAKDNATISNCYIYGGRNNIFVDSGNVIINDTVTECGTLANIQIQSTEAYTVTLNNVTTIQHQVNATIGDTTQIMMGAGVIVGPDTETNPTIVLDGGFKQYNWVTAEDKEAITNSTAQTIIQTALDATAFNHTVNSKTASNLGIIYLNNADAEVTNNTDLPYAFGAVEMLNQNGKVYSLQWATESQIYSDYENADRSTVNGDYMPTFEFNLGDQEISYDGSDDTRYLYGDENGITALYKDGEDPLTLDLTKLATVYKYTGMPYTVAVACKDSSGTELEQNNGVVTLKALGEYIIIFTVEDNIFYDNKGQQITKSVTREFSVSLTLTVKAADIKNATVDITKNALDGVYTTVNLTDYKLRINFLACISIADYDNTGAETSVDLTSDISSATLTPASVNVFTTASTITVTYTDGRVLTVSLSAISGSSAGTKTATVNTSGEVYFITDGALDNKPTEEASQNKCTITSVSYKGNSGSTVTNDTDVTVTWELGSSGGSDSCVTPDTLITLADGTQVRVDSLTGDELLLVWNLETGTFDVAPIMFVDSESEAEFEIIRLVFSDGTEVKVISEHGFWDYDLNKYVYLDRYADKYIGHTFAKQNGDELEAVTLVDVVIETELTTAWSPVTVGHLCYFVNGMLSMPGGVGGLFNIFEVDPETMTYDYEQLAKDIETYGLYTYEELNALCPLSEEMFNAAGGAYLKISIGKGNLTEEELYQMINKYSKFFN